jgi:hypothetical protein
MILRGLPILIGIAVGGFSLSALDSPISIIGVIVASILSIIGLGLLLDRFNDDIKLDEEVDE